MNILPSMEYYFLFKENDRTSQLLYSLFGKRALEKQAKQLKIKEEKK